jgi:hypothetical protein
MHQTTACSTHGTYCVRLWCALLLVLHKAGDNLTRPWSHGGNVAQVMAATALGQLDYSVTGVPVEGKLARIRKGDGHSKRKDMVCIVINAATSTVTIIAVCVTSAVCHYDCTQAYIDVF